MGNYKRAGKRKELVFKEEDWKIIVRKANESNMRTSNYIKKMAVTGLVIKINLGDLIFEVNKIGNNINQIAKKVNMNDESRKEDLIKVQNELLEINKLVSEYLCMMKGSPKDDW